MGHYASNCKVTVECCHSDGRHHTFFCYKLCDTNAVNSDKSTSINSHNILTQLSQAGLDQLVSLTACSAPHIEPMAVVQASIASVQHSLNPKIVTIAIPTISVQVSGGGIKMLV